MEKRPKCKICRRAGKKLFLKGEKCNTAKCPMVVKPYPPGIKGKRRLGGLSEYGRQLKEKQRLKNWYNLSEKQFKNYVIAVLEKSRGGKSQMGDAQEALVKSLEMRLDNAIYRLGIGSSRTKSRQLVSHGHFFVNGKAIDIPSFTLKVGDKITVRPSSLNKGNFKELSATLKKIQLPLWLKLDPEKIEAEVIGYPTVDIAAPPAEIQAIFEFYSK
ncbi:MAG: 30S ribosomal protein S4 [Candidatus Paceibacterota bacterium]|jgi:small subunit ribosomal protein S4|nr:30S ribosomal protein S4 [Candidatus Paceibacterota bacterium]